MLKDNMLFTLQAQSGSLTNGSYTIMADTEATGMAYRPGYSHPIPVYAASGFRAGLPPYWASTPIDPLRPWEVNVRLNSYQFTNTVAPCGSGTNSGSGSSYSGDGTIGYYSQSGLWVAESYYFDTAAVIANQSSASCSSMLSPALNRLLFNVPSLSPIVGSGGSAHVATGQYNAYGLPLQRIAGYYYDGFDLLVGSFLPGAACPDQSDFDLLYEQFQAPAVVPEFYLFTKGGDIASLSPETIGTNSGLAITNFLITSVGDSHFSVSAWLRYRLTNGYSGVYGYAEHYFDKAFKADANGNATTNQTGLLSPYGEFFPTEPGRIALTTLPDFETAAVGTGVVYAIHLGVDANHDGTIDRTFSGPDNTSSEHPFRFWINNDADDATADRQRSGITNSADNVINGARDLEDFARLWISGVPSLPSGYIARLSWSGDGSVKLYNAFESDGGIGYLTNESIAHLQADFSGSAPGTSIATISASSSYEFPANTFSNAFRRHFLFEGVAAGKGQLTFSIELGGTQVVARSVVHIELADVKSMYERVSILNIFQDWPEMVQQTNVSSFRVNYQPSYTPDADEVAVFVHGWRMAQWDYDNYSATMFKRLYWQGFRGRFASLRWPTRSSQTELFRGVDFITYNRSERIAFLSGTGAAAYFNDLRSRFPNYRISACAHSMGGIVVMQTLKQLAANGQRPLDNLVLMEAAVPANCFDPNVADYTPFVNQEQITPTPDVYRNYAAGITNALRTGGKIVNFFNPLDFALWTWQFNQALYITNFLGYGPTTMKPNTFFGYYTDGTNSILRTNDLNQSLLSIGYGGYYTNTAMRTVTNALELMPFVARPRSLAVGAQPSVHGQIQGQELNLQTQLGFTSAESDHSGQFNRNIQDGAIWPFYFQLRTNLFPNP